MEIMWDIPFIPEPLARPTPWHISCPSVLQALSQSPNFPYTLPSKGNQKKGEKEKRRKFAIKRVERKQKEKIPNQRLRESKKERKFPIKDRKKTEEICRKVFGTDNIWTTQNCHQVNKKRRETTTWSGPLPLIVNQNPVRRWLFRLTLNKNRKGKGQKHSKPNFPQKANHFQEKVLLIHDHACNLWFDRKWFAKVMTYLWFGIRMKHLPVWDRYTLSDFPLFLSDAVFPLNGHLEAKC